MRCCCWRMLVDRSATDRSHSLLGLCMYGCMCACTCMAQSLVRCSSCYGSMRPIRLRRKKHTVRCSHKKPPSKRNGIETLLLNNKPDSVQLRFWRVAVRTGFLVQFRVNKYDRFGSSCHLTLLGSHSSGCNISTRSEL